MLGISRPTIRSDLSLLVMLGLIDAKPKVGYFIGQKMSAEDRFASKLREMKVKEVQGVPVVVSDTATVNDAVIALFLENVGSLVITDQEGSLKGIVSRKDLLKVTLGNASAASMPISLVMTREPNIISVTPEDSVLEAARKLVHHQIDALPVVRKKILPNGSEINEIVGRITKTTMTALLLDIMHE